MKTIFELHLRAFPVQLLDRDTGSITDDVIVLEKKHLQAAQLVGESSKELIHRLYGRMGQEVLEIGKPERMEVPLDLQELYLNHVREAQMK